MQEADEARAEEAVGLFLSRLVAQVHLAAKQPIRVHLAAKQLHHLPPATQREALEMCTK
ncbi:hypothetical protein T484DRAFT_1840070, partial [Baffinella frigidus]